MKVGDAKGKNLSWCHAQDLRSLVLLNCSSPSSCLLTFSTPQASESQVYGTHAPQDLSWNIVSACSEQRQGGHCRILCILPLLWHCRDTLRLDAAGTLCGSLQKCSVVGHGGEAVGHSGAAGMFRGRALLVCSMVGWARQGWRLILFGHFAKGEKT